MSAPTDEAAARGAALAGERVQLLPSSGASHLPPRYAIEPASSRRDGRDRRGWAWRKGAEVLFHSWAPICDVCGEEVEWLGPPTRRPPAREADPLPYIYAVRCACGDDEIESDQPLLMGGTARGFWHRFLGWDLATGQA